MRWKFLFTASLAGSLVGVVPSADGSESDYDRAWSPYVTVRGGWLFGTSGYRYHWKGHDFPGGAPDEEKDANRDRSFGNAFAGSGEVGASLWDDSVSIGLELGYFGGKKEAALTGNDPNSDFNYTGVIYFEGFDGYCAADGKYKNLFAAVNVTLKKEVGERTFLYGGVGVGTTRSDFGRIHYRYHEYGNPGGGGAIDELHDGVVNFKTKWRLLSQAFAGVGIYLNDHWALTVGYRLRYLSGAGHEIGKFARDRVQWNWKVKQDLIHTAEVGLTYQF